MPTCDERREAAGDPEAEPVGRRDDGLGHHRAGRVHPRRGERGRVGLDDAAGALAVDDRHDDGVRVGAGELGAHRHGEGAAQAVGDVEHEQVLGGLVVVDAEVAERVGVQPGAVPRVEPVLRRCRAARRSVGSEMTEASDSSSGGRSASTGRSVGSTPSSTSPTRTQNSMPSSKAAKVRQSPVAPSRSSGIPCQRHRTVPSTTSHASRRAPRCGQAPGPASSRRRRRRARARPRDRRRCAAGCGRPARRRRRRRRASRGSGGAAPRAREASMRAGLASRQVPRRWSGVVWGR